MAFISRLLDVPVTDPDDARRRKLLNFLISFVALLAILTMLFTIYLDVSGAEEDAEERRTSRDDYLLVIPRLDARSLSSTAQSFMELPKLEDLPGNVTSSLKSSNWNTW